MGRRLFKIGSITFVYVFLTIVGVNAQTTQEEKHIKVSLRMIGHQVLLQFGDSSSRVLPIEHIGEQYIIKFESKFEFNPEDLVAITKQVAEDTDFALEYIVEVEECQTKEVVYSFEVNNLEKESDIAPCSSRDQPESCYQLLFTLLDSVDEVSSESVQHEDKSTSNSTWLIFFLTILIPIIVVFAFMRRKRKSQQSVNPDIIPIGKFQFDKRNAVLLLGQNEIELTSKEADLLMLLHESANSTVEREHILNAVWGDEGDYIGRTLDVFISKLRKKLEADENIKITNTRGVGYKLVF